MVGRVPSDPMVVPSLEVNSLPFGRKIKSNTSCILYFFCIFFYFEKGQLNNKCTIEQKCYKEPPIHNRAWRLVKVQIMKIVIDNIGAY